MKHYNGFTPQQRQAAQNWLNAQWKSGALARPHECCACGQTEGIIDAHTEDYSQPYEAGKTDEFHLCYRCHMALHCRHHNLESWERYRLDLQMGLRFGAFFGRNYERFKAQHLAQYAPTGAVFVSAREDVLGRIVNGR